MPVACILSIGTELTLGQTVDTNGAWLARELAALGLRATRHLTVPDDHELIRAAFVDAAGHADVIVATGGLGPTADDLTRAAVAAAAGDTLVLDADSLAQIEAFFTARGRTMPPPNRVQAERPSRARPLPNTCGTAPGLALQLGDAACFVLPGVPQEMVAMFAEHVRPALAARFAGAVVRCRRLQTFGLPESELGEQIRDLMQRGRNPEVGTTAAHGVIGIRINATAASPAGADELLAATEHDLRTRLGPAVFGTDDDTLAAAVGRLLAAGHCTLAVAESCTGGLIGRQLTDVPGASTYFLGGVIAYANEAKAALLGVASATLAAHGAVSAPAAVEMARGVQARLGTDYALAVTGVAGPGGGTPAKPVGLVYLGLATPAGVTAREQRYGELPRELIRQRAAAAALDWLRRELLATQATTAEPV